VDGSGNLLLSVLIAPDLAGGATGTLADFPDFQNWPQTLTNAATNQSCEWVVSFTINGFTQRISVPFSGTALNPDMWTELFPSTVEYGPPEPVQDRFRNLPIVSYPVQQVTGFLQGQYAQYSLTEVPTIATLQNVYGPISDVLVGVAAQERMQKLAADRTARSQNGTVPHANDFVGASMAESFAAQAFYHMAGAAAAAIPTVPDIDFHKALTFIGQHGVLQRALGLVFDLKIGSKEIRELSDTLNSNVFVSVIFENANDGAPFSPGYTPITPRTHCDASHTQFQAHSSTGNLDNGQLVVGDPTSYLAHVIDFDGAGLRAANFATQVLLTQAPAAIHPRYVAAAVPVDTSTPMAPPMIRSNGLTLTEVNRGSNLATTLQRAFLLFDAVVNDNPVPDLNAEDLVRGYVLDVLDQDDNVWRSTAEWVPTFKAGAVTVDGTTTTPPSGAPYWESATQAPPRVQSSPDDPDTTQANVSEVVLRYNGWSNAVPRPGTVLQDADSQVTSPNPIPFNQLSISVVPPPGRLPPLRFGHTYAMRARVIDVAGNAIPVDDGAAVGDADGRVTDPMVYGRHEPIGSPDLYSQSIPRPAESLKRLVIRDIDSSTPSLRTLAPQRCAEPFAEWHSLFDTGAGSAINGNATTYNLIVGRESAHYPDPPADPSTAPTPITLTAAVPYLPDPLARGGVLTVLTGNSLVGQTQPFDFSPASGGKWPNFRPFGLQLQPGANAPNQPAQTWSVDQTTRMITFTLTEGDTITVNLSATCDPGDIPLFGLGYWVNNFDANEAASGQYWSITPADQLELVYAVQKPLLTPEFVSLPTPGRSAGDTFVQLPGVLSWSPKSTSEIDVLASWGDPVDDPVDKLPLQGPGTPNPALRLTANAPVATIPSTDSPLASAGTQDYAAGQGGVGEPFNVRHEFFDTKHRNVTYQAIATSQFTEFYAPGTDTTVSTQHPVLVDILSTARPDTPKISHVVPIYDWELTQPNSKTTVSERSPSALRIFLSRPWWSSGIDELLGVVTWPAAEAETVNPFPIARLPRSEHKQRVAFGFSANTAIPDDQSQYVTDWGADPVFAGPVLPSLHPRLSSFPNAIESGFGLTLEEKPGITVNVAGHQVAFDAARSLWYCDVAVNTGEAYTPMIRLALARYQPNSISGVELSRVVLADIMSLEPGRTATIVRQSAHHLSSVTLTGYSYARAAGARNVAPGQAEIIVEKRLPAVQDATLGWEQVREPIQMSAGQLRAGGTEWIARNIKLPGGTLRLVINQYEVLPTDNREPTRGFYILARPSRELRLLHQDVIPL
jgi:hypothetical protein